MPCSTACSSTRRSSPPPTATASFLEQDATTQGSWIGTYGAQGYDIVSGPSSLPANDTVTPSGQSTYTWTTTSSDPRALQVPGSSNRVAAVWYSATSFTVDVNLADGQTHDLELYFDDWDNRGRSEQVQISDAGTGTVLDTETISSFTSGVYLDWKVSGNLVITITRQAGVNAVLNGLFLDGAKMSAASQDSGRVQRQHRLPVNPVEGRAAIARGSGGGFAIHSAGVPVDAVLGALPEDVDAQTSPISSLVQELAVEQIGAQGRQSEPSSARLSAGRAAVDERGKAGRSASLRPDPRFPSTIVLATCADRAGDRFRLSIPDPIPRPELAPSGEIGRKSIKNHDGCRRGHHTRFGTGPDPGQNHPRYEAVRSRMREFSSCAFFDLAPKGPDRSPLGTGQRPQSTEPCTGATGSGER